MRVAYVCADAGVPVFGKKGASIHVQEVVGAFLKLGADIELFAVRFDGECPPELRAMKVHRLTQTAKGDVAAREKALLALNQELRQSVEREDPFDLIYERYSLWSFGAIEYAHDSRTPSVLEVNAPLIEEQAEHRALIDRAAAERIAATARSRSAQMGLWRMRIRPRCCAKSRPRASGLGPRLNRFILAAVLHRG